MSTAETESPLVCRDPKYLLDGNQPKPDFLLIGGAKCGTTSFAAYFPAHPQVAPWEVKEPTFWSWRKPTAQQYQSLFCNRQTPSLLGANQQIAGDYSTSYLLHPLVPRRVCAALPDIKIVVMLRNPIDRAYSHYVMSRRSGLEDHQSFDDIVVREMEQAPELLNAHDRGFHDDSCDLAPCCSDEQGKPLYFPLHNRNWTRRPLLLDNDLQSFYFTSYVFRSIYYPQLARWLALFPRSQVLLIQAEKFFRKPAQHMAQAASFMGLESHDFASNAALKRAYAGSAAGDWAPPEKYPPMKKTTRKLLRGFFAPYNEKLYKLIDEDYGWR
jgi:hypothetical protein